MGLGGNDVCSKCVNLDKKSLKSRFQLFGGPEIGCFPVRGQCQPARQEVLSNPGPAFAIFGRASSQMFEKIQKDAGFSAQGPYSKSQAFKP